MASRCWCSSPIGRKRHWHIDTRPCERVSRRWRKHAGVCWSCCPTACMVWARRNGQNSRWTSSSNSNRKAMFPRPIRPLTMVYGAWHCAGALSTPAHTGAVSWKAHGTAPGRASGNGGIGWLKRCGRRIPQVFVPCACAAAMGRRSRFGGLRRSSGSSALGASGWSSSTNRKTSGIRPAFSSQMHCIGIAVA